jgi:hypothetical protein
MSDTITINETTVTNGSTVKFELAAPPTVEELNKKISRTIFFKDRMLAINDGLVQGKTEHELNMTVFEIETRAKKGNYVWARGTGKKPVKLFNWYFIKGVIDKIKDLREEKAQLLKAAA